MPSPLEFLVIAAVLALNGVLAAYEMAISAIPHARLGALERAGVRGASAAVFMKQRIERTLAVIQLGITLLAALAAAFGGQSVEEKLAPALESSLGLSPGTADFVALVAVVIPLAAATIVFAELAPKILAIRHKERVCCTLSPPMRVVAQLLAPVVGSLERAVTVVLRPFTRSKAAGGRGPSDPTSLHELTAAAALARTARLIGAREERIVTAAAQLSSRALREIELPAADISMLPADATLEAALVRAHLDMHTRFPVARVDGDPQTIEGYVTFKDLVALVKMASGPVTLRAAMRPILLLARTTAISAALDSMVRGHSHIALVVDKESRVSGLVTLEDILEELVGDIQDEFDRLPAHVTAAGDGVIAGGGAALDAVAARLGLEAAALSPERTASDGARPTSLADWVQRELGRAPAGGELITRGGVQVSVRKLRRKRLSEAFVRRIG